MNIRSIFILFILIFCSVAHSQEENSVLSKDKKTLNITRATQKPKIDGVLDDAIWENAEIATGFIQFRPDIGNTRQTEERTEVKMSYDDDAIYVAAYLYDDPTKILKQLTSRDNFGQNDFFAVILNPNNDAQNDTEFFVFSSGQQADAIANPSIGEDFSWNAVWQSAVQIVDDGWIVEMEIPYRTLRFADQEEPTWGLQFHRHFRRERSQYTWNKYDPTQGNIGLYHGELKGLKNLKPPVRLNLYPFSTGILNSYDGETDTDLTFGMDVKYGITDNFTLDATLVPDFSQAGFDRVVLNLGPFEQTFSEQRQFFTEGVDLFSKGDLFFSRRVGGKPSGELQLADNEEANIPEEVKVLNALKVSGRTKKGLGVGIFNAITEKTYATVTNTDTNEKRREVVEPFTNYNILVVDQQFNGNSSVSLINTNVMREGEFRDANATALVTNLQNKRNTYRIRGEAKMSNVNPQFDNTQTGYSTFFYVAKSHGNLRYSFDHSFADTKYEINDLGLNFRNNFNNFGADIWYQIFEPKGNLNRYSASAYINYRNLANPGTFTGTNFGAEYNAQTKTLNNYGFWVDMEPGKQYDYFESRDGRYFIYENIASTGGYYSSNYNKVFAFDVNANTYKIFEDGRDLFGYNLSLSPRVRPNDKLLMVYSFNLNMSNGSRGYATYQDDQPIFGERNRKRVTNTISANYTFNPFNSLALTFRHYWDTVNYDNELFTLLDNGLLTTEQGYTVDNVEESPNINFSTWNIDLSYSWQFAPGSFLTALYRNQLFNFDTMSQDSYSESLDTLFDQPIQHTISVRLQYFLDFNGIKSIFKKNDKPQTGQANNFFSPRKRKFGINS
ncbi:MAG: protein with DOMON-like ligand-binding domain protein [Flavobacteriaceae bacterium]|nr:protein with DOMON-like ligand-binding domain protein [Flavobacteriaceae bacterium]